MVHGPSTPAGSEDRQSVRMRLIPVVSGALSFLIHSRHSNRQDPYNRHNHFAGRPTATEADS